MKSSQDVENLVKLIGQLRRLYSEIAQLARKAPNDGLNLFKLKLINEIITSGNVLLKDRYKPFGEFQRFEEDNLPTNSDVTMILAQYMEQAERLRSDHVAYSEYKWVYVIDGKPSDIETNEPTRVGGENK